MDWRAELILVLRTVISLVLGALIGVEREKHGKEAGIRTYAAVALGSCTFGLISLHANGMTVDTRIASNIVTGIGFLCAGIIFKDSNRVSGLTTAATIWSTAAMGLAIAFGMYLLGILTGLLIYIILVVHHLPFWKKLKKNPEEDQQTD